MQNEPLNGELRCGFGTTANGPLLLIAAGNVASKVPAEALVKIDGVVARVSSPGGFNGMVKGATFTGSGHTLRITLTGPATGGGESPPRPATLRHERSGSTTSNIVGQWVCGP
ncbi:hypothetical protein [Cystobacter fuscus]|uniref:hypothetical protein n=1 Tax=Cystobacter fuscus TaxID=43 RepID=UPI002B2F2C93|nr:hypothetical protein F0U63_29465 [Cystobacter fuscus]